MAFANWHAGSAGIKRKVRKEARWKLQINLSRLAGAGVTSAALKARGCRRSRPCRIQPSSGPAPFFGWRTDLGRDSRTKRAQAHRSFTTTYAHHVETLVPVEPIDLDVPWYLVLTTPRGEKRAAEMLKKAGCEVFLPLMHKVSVTNKRRVEYEVATYTGYVFASGIPSLANSLTIVGEDGRTGLTVDGIPISDIRQLGGVRDVIRDVKGEFAVVPAAAMALMVSIQNGKAPTHARAPYEVGEQVRVISGPFMSFNAIVSAVLDKASAEVLINIFGRETRMQLGLAEIGKL